MRIAIVVGMVFLGALLVLSVALDPRWSGPSDERISEPVQTSTLVKGDDEARRERQEKEAAAQEEEQAYASAKEALTSVRYSLTDPSSALFKDVWAVRGAIADAPPTVFACGAVNAKNAFGAYAGYVPFVAVGSTVLTPTDSVFPRVFQQVCLGGKKLFPVRV